MHAYKIVLNQINPKNQQRKAKPKAEAEESPGSCSCRVFLPFLPLSSCRRRLLPPLPHLSLAKHMHAVFGSLVFFFLFSPLLFGVALPSLPPPNPFKCTKPGQGKGGESKRGKGGQSSIEAKPFPPMPFCRPVPPSRYPPPCNHVASDRIARSLSLAYVSCVCACVRCVYPFSDATQTPPHSPRLLLVHAVPSTETPFPALALQQSS